MRTQCTRFGDAFSGACTAHRFRTGLGIGWTQVTSTPRNFVADAAKEEQMDQFRFAVAYMSTLSPANDAAEHTDWRHGLDAETPRDGIDLRQISSGLQSLWTRLVSLWQRTRRSGRRPRRDLLPDSPEWPSGLVTADRPSPAVG